LARNSAALLSLAACCRWWDHKARKWYYHSIQGEEEADGHDWSVILLLCSHWLHVVGGGITRPESGITTAYKERRRRTAIQVFYVLEHSFMHFCTIAVMLLNRTGGVVWVLKPPVGSCT
jgi:hypothetical protein